MQLFFQTLARRATLKQHTRQLITVVALLGLIFTNLPAQHVYADSTITVNTTADNATAGDGACTLREAINNANAASDTTSGDCAAGSGTDTITFSVTGTITLGSNLPSISRDVTIGGPGAGMLTVDGAGTYQPFHVNRGAALSLDGLTIANGYAHDGGGIHNAHATLVVSNSTLLDNSAIATGGGIFNDLGGTLTVTDSTFSGNSAANHGGAIMVVNGSTATVTGSTFSGNSATNQGGGILNQGTLTVTNSTFSGNSAPMGGGLMTMNGIVTILNSTIAGNSAGTGGGVGNEASLVLQNTIVAGSTSGGDCYTSSTATTNAQNSLIQDGLTCVNGTSTNNLTGDPSLGALANNGGPTETMALLPGSIAIDAADDSLCPATDQRGVTRPQGLHCDIGAYEALIQGPPTIYTQPQSQTRTSGQTATLSVVAIGSNLSYQWYQGTSGDTSTPVGTDSDTFTTPALTSDTSYWVRVSNPNGSVDSDTATITIISAQPGTILVNTTADNATAGDGACTLREAINNANAASDTTSGDCTAGSGTNTITFSVTGTITLGSNLPGISSDVTIDGPGASMLTVDGAGAYLPFHVNRGAALSLDSLTIANGYAHDGGGIHNAHATLVVSNSTLLDNSAIATGGGIFNDLGGTLTVTDSNFSGNFAANHGGAIMVVNGSTATVTGSTFSGNSATNQGGGILNQGTLMVINSTFSGNSAPTGGGLMTMNGIVTILNSTIAGNSAGTGGGVGNEATLVLQNTIVAGSSSGGDCYTSSTATTNAQNSLIQDGLTCVNGTNTNNLTGDPSLGALTGSPAYYPLNAGSIAINAGDNALAVDQNGNPLTTDESGNPRILGGTVDMGAYEATVTAPTITTQPQSQMIASGQTATLTVVASGSRLSYQWYQGSSGDTSTPTGTDSDTFTTPALTSDTSYWVRVSNPAGSVDSDTATILIKRPPTITSANSTSFTEGVAGSFTVTTAAGVPPATTISESGALPGGVSFTDNGDGTATLSGTPAIGTFGTYNLSITASNGIVPDATQNFTLNVLPDTVQVTVKTDPSGLSFTVDGTTYSSSQTFTWTHGTLHTLLTSSPQAGTPGTQYVFDNWSDGGGISHSVTAPGTDTTYTATFKTQYQLTTAVNPSNGGSVSPASGTYYDANTDVSLTATANSGFAFLNWTGNVADATAANTTITMSGPQSVTANFKASTSLLYNGDQLVNIGNNIELAAQLSSPASACLSGQAINFSLDVNPLDGSAGPYSLGSATTGSNGQATLSVSTSGWQEGIYDITASFAGTTDCDPASDDATLTAASPGDSATGGGWYPLSGSGHINFGFNVRKVDSNCQSDCAYKGQMLLINNGKWRLKGTLDSYVKTSTGQGAASGSGDLYWWDQSLNGGLGDWVLAQSGVSFTINFYDSGQKGKKSSDTFGINIQYVPVPPQPNALPNSAPQLLKGGDIKVN